MSNNNEKITESQILDVEIITTFNNYLVTLIEHLSRACPNSIIGNNKNWVLSIMKTDPPKMIELFMYYILKDKAHIDEGNDDYFLKDKNYVDVVNDYSKSHANGDSSSLVSKVFEFRSIWFQLTENNKVAVKTYMKILCELTNDYFVSQDLKGTFRECLI